MTNIFDEDSMRAVVNKAIFDSLTDQQRNDLVEKAIQGLLMVPVKKNTWDTGQSVMEQQLALAASTVCRKVLEEELAQGGTLRERLISIMNAVLDKALAADQYGDVKIVENMAEAFVNSFKIKERF